MIELYFPSQEKYRVIKTFKNGIDLIETGGHQYVSKLYPRNSDLGRLSFFEDLQNFTSNRLKISPYVINTADGRTNTTISDGIIELTDYVEGIDFDIAKIKDDGSIFREIGSFLAKVHLAFDEFSKFQPNKFKSVLNYYPESSTHLNDLLKNYQEQEVESLWVKMLEEKIRIVKELTSDRDDFQDLPQGIVHGDFYPKNILFDEDMKIIGLIDYAQAGEFFRCYEIMRGLIQTNKFLGRTKIDHTDLTSYLRGYQEHIILNHIELRKMLDLYIYIQASDISFNGMNILNGNDEELKSYAKFRYDSLISLYQNRAVLNALILKTSQGE